MTVICILTVNFYWSFCYAYSIIIELIYFQDDAVEPVRAAALRSYLARRVGSGYTLQRDPTRSGQFYIELRVYNSKEAETLAANRWKRALFTLRSSHDDSGPVWKALTGLVSAAKQEYAKIKPILYPSNVF